MELVDLKSPKKTTKDMKAGMMPSPMEQDQYPWGTKIDLNEESLAKLGDLFDDAVVGEEANVTAKAKIVSKRANDTVGGDGKKKKNRSLELQITKINVECKSAYDKGTMDEFMKKRQKK
jgi:hypothetical protein